MFVFTHMLLIWIFLLFIHSLKGEPMDQFSNNYDWDELGYNLILMWHRID